MRLQKIGLIGIVFIFTTCLAFSCISSAFAQCPPDTFLCTGFPDWCCVSEQYCVDPTPPDCQRIVGTTTVNPNCGSDEWDCGDGTCCPIWASCCKGACCDREREICDNGQCREVCVFYQTYGEDSTEVELLRAFRDEVLSHSPVGQEIIKLYYMWSPAIVKMMEEDETFKADVEEMIDGILPLIGETE